MREDKALVEDVTRKLSSGDEVFETLEVRRRLTIVPPGTLSGEDEDEDEHLDIAYDDELIYEDDQEDIDDEIYERYSDDEMEEDPEVIPDEISTPETFEELNALYKPKFEEKLTAISPRTRPTVGVQMLSPVEGSSTVNDRPLPPFSGITKENSPRVIEAVLEKKVPPASPRRSPQPQPPQVEEEYNDEEDYSDDLYEGEVESDVDDEDLMRRLEEKYGKLPPGQEEDLGDSELEGEEEEEEDEDDPSWTSKVK